MTLPLGLRRLALTAHIVCSVGWLGAIGAFLGLAVAALVSDDIDLVRGIYLAMEVSGWYVLVPLALASLLTGLVQSFGTRWGLFRHYWVVFKLVINVAATVVLLAYMQTLEYFGTLARTSSDLAAFQSPSPLVHSLAALLLLAVATVLGVYKPRGLTPYGQRKQRSARSR